MWSDYNETNCQPNYSYFGSSDYLRNAYHIIAFFTIPLSLFTFYVILKVTPERMKNMRIPLLIAHSWSTNLDLMFTIFTRPYVFGPSSSGMPLGILGELGIPVKWQFYWAQVSSSMMATSIVMLFENRHSQITTIRYFQIRRPNTRLAYYLLLTVFSFIVYIPFYLENTDQLEMRRIILERIPCPTIEFWDSKTYVLLKGGETLPFISVILGVGSMVIQSAFFLVLTIYHLTVVPCGRVSDTTRKLQKKFLKYVLIQISIPWISFLVPVLYVMYCDQIDFYNQAYNNQSTLVMSSHGLLSTICTLFVYRPYRDYINCMITGKKEEGSATVAIGSAVDSYI